MYDARRVAPTLLRLFLSSTFRDTQAERDILTRLVLPRLRAALAAQNAVLQEIDLRWGVTASMSMDAGAVAICLRELDQCAPLVLGIATRRVGWRPPPQAVSHFDLAFARTVPPGAGMTEIELRYALHLAAAGPAARLPVMVRSDRLSRALTSGEDDADASGALRQWVLRAAGIDALEYDSLDEFESRAEGVLRPLLAATAAQGGGRRAVLRPPAEIARSTDLRSLDRAAGRRKPTLVHGPRGAGLTWLVKRWVGSDPHGLYVDGKAVSARLLVEALSGRRGHDMPAPDPMASAVLARFAGEAGTRRIVLDHFEHSFPTETQADLSWVPGRLPRGCSLLLVTRSERLRETAGSLGWSIHHVAPIPAPEAVAFAQAYLGAFGKHLTPPQAARLAASPWLADLGSLVLVLDELRRFGRLELLDRRLDELVACASGPQIAEEVLAGLRSVLPGPWSRAADAALAAMRLSLRGLQEDEIRATCAALAGEPAGDLPPHLWSAIRVSLGSALAARGPRIDIASGPLLEWSDRRLLDVPHEIPRVASALARALRTAPSVRRWEEAPRLAEAADPLHGLEQLLADPRSVLSLLDVGESFCGGWLDRLTAEARTRAVHGWADQLEPAAQPDDIYRLALLAARGGATAAAHRLLLRAEAGAPGSSASGRRHGAQVGLLALLLDDRMRLKELARDLLSQESRAGDRSEDTMNGLAVIAACSDGRIELQEAEQRALIARLMPVLHRLGDPLQQAQLHLYVGQLAVGRARWREAAGAFDAAERGARTVGHARSLCRALERQSAVAIERHRYRAARRAAVECRDLARKTGLAELEALGFERQIEVERRRANWKEAYALAEQFLTRCREGLADQRRALHCIDQLEAPH